MIDMNSQPFSSDNTESYIFVGGGLPSMLFAKVLLRRGLDPSQITLVEKSETLGGQFRSVSTRLGQTFDLGMHIYYETDVRELDEAFIDILPMDAWNFLEGNRKDIAGIYFKGRIQRESPYPDLRTLRERKKRKVLRELEKNRVGQHHESTNVLDELESHFGKFVTRSIFKGVMKNLYRINPKQIDKLAFKLTAINRISILDAEQAVKIENDKYLRARIAYPDQMNMPWLRSSPSRGVYPKKFGFGNVIDALENQLIEAGVTIFRSSSIRIHEIDGNKIVSVVVKSGNKEFNIESPKLKLVWTTDVFQLAKELGFEVTRPNIIGKKRYIFLQVREKVNLGSLYYLYNFDRMSRIFRVTNYSNYCPDAGSNSTTPICVEYWGKKNMDDSEIERNTRRDLVRMGIVFAEDQIIHSELGKNPILFPTPTLDTIDSIRKVNELISRTQISNLVTTGTLSSPSVFFLHEVLRDGYGKILKGHQSDK